MARAKEEKKEGDGAETKLYELAYHILPTVAEEDVTAEVSKLRELVESRGGIIVSDEMPKSVALAYPMPKDSSGKRQYFESAHFGWMRFQMAGEEAPTLGSALKAEETILRFLIMKVVREKAMRPPKKMKFFARDSRERRRPEGERHEPSKERKPDKGLSEAELDKTIEELIAE